MDKETEDKEANDKEAKDQEPETRRAGAPRDLRSRQPARFSPYILPCRAGGGGRQRQQAQASDEWLAEPAKRAAAAGRMPGAGQQAGEGGHAGCMRRTAAYGVRRRLHRAYLVVPRHERVAEFVRRKLGVHIAQLLVGMHKYARVGQHRSSRMQAGARAERTASLRRRTSMTWSALSSTSWSGSWSSLFASPPSSSPAAQLRPANTSTTWHARSRRVRLAVFAASGAALGSGHRSVGEEKAGDGRQRDGRHRGSRRAGAGAGQPR